MCLSARKHNIYSAVFLCPNHLFRPPFSFRGEINGAEKDLAEIILCGGERKRCKLFPFPYFILFIFFLDITYISCFLWSTDHLRLIIISRSFTSAPRFFLEGGKRKGNNRRKCPRNKKEEIK